MKGKSIFIFARFSLHFMPYARVDRHNKQADTPGSGQYVRIAEYL